MSEPLQRVEAFGFKLREAAVVLSQLSSEFRNLAEMVSTASTQEGGRVAPPLRRNAESEGKTKSRGVCSGVTGKYHFCNNEEQKRHAVLYGHYRCPGCGREYHYDRRVAEAWKQSPYV